MYYVLMKWHVTLDLFSFLGWFYLYGCLLHWQPVWNPRRSHLLISCPDQGKTDLTLCDYNNPPCVCSENIFKLSF